ncbi:hypothetical protein ACP3TB_17220 [Rahnella variigena]|uniref:hypothetical protein n=1 Tax=Rahnella variigena TaxID=574964 RepID=UPI003CED48A9
MLEMSSHFISVERNISLLISILKQYKDDSPSYYNNDYVKRLIKNLSGTRRKLLYIESSLDKNEFVVKNNDLTFFRDKVLELTGFLTIVNSECDRLLNYENNFELYLDHIKDISSRVDGFASYFTVFIDKVIRGYNSRTNESFDVLNDDVERMYIQSKSLLDDMHTEYQSLLSVTSKLNIQQEKLDEIESRYRKSLVQFNVDEESYKQKKSIIDQSEEIASKFLTDVSTVNNTIADITVKYTSLNNTISQLSTLTNGLDTTLREKLKEIDLITEQANDVLNNATTVAVGGHFKQQYDDSKRNVLWWPILGALFLLGAIAICVLTVFPEIMRSFSDNGIPNEKGDELKFIISRLVVAPLFLVGAWFCASQYVKQKNIIEDYAYKKVLSLSLLSIKSEIEKTGEQNTTEFIRAVQNEILRSPLDALDRKHLKNEVKFLKMVQSEVMQNILKGVSKSKGNKDKSI